MAYGVCIGQFENSLASSAQSSDSGYGSDDGNDDVGGPAVIVVNAGDDAGDELEGRRRHRGGPGGYSCSQ